MVKALFGVRKPITAEDAMPVGSLIAFCASFSWRRTCAVTKCIWIPIQCSHNTFESSRPIGCLVQDNQQILRLFNRLNSIKIEKQQTNRETNNETPKPNKYNKSKSGQMEMIKFNVKMEKWKNEKNYVYVSKTSKIRNVSCNSVIHICNYICEWNVFMYDIQYPTRVLPASHIKRKSEFFN